MTQPQEAVLVGGPRDGDQFHAADSALVELEVDGYFHRYIRTTATRAAGGQNRLVYNYDGMVRPAMTSDDPVQPAADAGVDPTASIEPRNQGAL